MGIANSLSLHLWTENRIADGSFQPDARSAAERYWSNPGQKTLRDYARLRFPPEPDTEALAYSGIEARRAWSAPRRNSFAL